MRAEIIKIGNSRGLRIPSAILKHCRMNDIVSLNIEDNKLIITPYEERRVNWGKIFQKMAKNEDDQLLDMDLIDHSWDGEEWKW